MRVLVVDDDRVCRTVVNLTLTKICNDAQVDSAIDGVDAVAMVLAAYKQQKPYQLVCLDCHMAQMDGPEAAALIRKYEVEQQLPRCPICVISSDDECEHIFNQLLGNDPSIYYLIKPLELEKLRNLSNFVQDSYANDDTLLNGVC